MIHSVSNNQLKVSKWDSGKGEEEETVVFITQIQTGSTN